MNDIGKFRDIISNSFNSGILFEAPFWNTAKNAGEQKRKDLIDKMNKAWEEWLGMTNLPGTQRDMINFLVSRVGFSKYDAAKILDIVGTPMVNSNGGPENKETQKQEEPSDKEKEKIEPKLNPEPKPDTSYVEIKDLNSAYNNLNHGLSKKTKTTADTDIIYRSVMEIARQVDNIPSVDLNQYNDVMQDAVSFLETASGKYKIDTNEANVILYNIQKRMKDSQQSSQQNTQDSADQDNLNDSVDYSLNEDENAFLDQKLSKKEISDIFNDAASYAFANNIVGNKNYARANGIGSDTSTGYSGYSHSSSGLSRPVEKASQLNDFAQKVFNSSAFSGMNDETISNLRALSKKGYDQITDQGDIKALANIGWAFLRNLR